MIRIIIENLLLFLLPTLIYAAFVFLQRRGTAAPGAVFDDAPLLWLLGAGVALVVITLIVFGSTSGGRPGQSYEPAVVKDGRIEPGHIK